jgi:hypothetical protein
MFIYVRQRQTGDTAESGFVLVLAMVVLLVITLLGIWALNTSTFELKVAGGSQQAEKQFNVAEGAANVEAGKYGFGTQSFYQLSDPSISNQLLIPTTDATFDPGNDTATTFAGITAGDFTTWPWENLLQNYNNDPIANEFDYRYLVTFLHADTAPMGYDASTLAGYKIRAQGATGRSSVVVELGGIKIGNKSTL